ncbi:MAG: class I SAM-dependent methyltransferase, partial [Acidimicrobiales bacterium]
MTNTPTGVEPGSTMDWRTRGAVRAQRRHWGRSVALWDHHGVAGLERVIAAVLARAKEGGPVELAVDVGTGTGALALPLAVSASRVVAVDVSEGMLARLREHASASGIGNIEPVLSPVEELTFPPASVDLIVSNYVLHHLVDREKRRFVERAAGWLRPGGRLVIGDVMVGRGAAPEDRAILASKARIMLRRGPGGWWRIAKNAWRLMTRT